MRATLVHNPTAGTKGHGKEFILAALRLADLETRYFSTKDRAVEAGLHEPADVIVVAGGDGTVGYVFTTMPDRSIPVAILPLGSANNVARSLGIAGTPQELVDCWQIDRTVNFDIARLTGLGKKTAFIEAFGVGLFADLIERRANGEKSDGAVDLHTGRRALQQLLRKAEPFDVDIEADGNSHSSKVLGIEVLNIAYTGPGLPLAPCADPGDGLLDLAIMEARQRDALVRWIDAPRKSPPPVTWRKVFSVTLRWRDALHRVDDEIGDDKRGEKRVEIRYAGDPLRVVAPPRRGF